MLTLRKILLQDKLFIIIFIFVIIISIIRLIIPKSSNYNNKTNDLTGIIIDIHKLEDISREINLLATDKSYLNRKRDEISEVATKKLDYRILSQRIYNSNIK